jgi:hypothetical protein
MATDRVQTTGTREYEAAVPRRLPVEDFASEGECVLYVPARDEACTLNRTATEVWSLCDGARDARAIARVLGDRYGLDAALLVEDVTSVLVILHTRGVIELSYGR